MEVLGGMKDEKELTNIDFSESRNQLPNDKIISGMKTKELVTKFTI